MQIVRRPPGWWALQRIEEAEAVEEVGVAAVQGEADEPLSISCWLRQRSPGISIAGSGGSTIRRRNKTRSFQ